jgi:membrane fusion protein
MHQNQQKFLFRSSATEYMGNRCYGDIVLARPVSFRLLTGLIATIAVAIVLFLVFFSYTRKVQVTGVLLPTQGLLRITTSYTGVITDIRIANGKSVQAGDVLFVLNHERTNSLKGSTEQVVAQLLQERRKSFDTDKLLLRTQSEQHIDALQRKAAGFSLDISSINEQLALQQRRVDITEARMARFKQLATASFISVLSVQEKEAEWIDQRTRLGDLQREKSKVSRERDAVKAELQVAAIQVERDIAAVGRSVSILKQDLNENEAHRQQFIRAPQAGTVSGITAHLGALATNQQALASLSPHASPLVAELYAQSNAAGFIKPGMSVSLRYQAYPYQKFGQFRGVVQEVANTPLSPNELAIPGAAAGLNSNTPIYLVRVKLSSQSIKAYGERMQLKAGMAVDASLLLDKRRLIEWVLEPLYSISGKA